MLTITKHNHNLTGSCQPPDKQEPRFFWERCVKGSDFQTTCKLHSKAAGSSLEKMPCNSDLQACTKVELLYLQAEMTEDNRN